LSIFFTADNHFGHKNILRYEDRPFTSLEEMREVMIAKWNTTVKPTDQIYMLGDLIFGRGKEANELVKRLNGTKYFIRGNHDGFLNDTDFDRSLFVWVKDYFMLRHDNMKFALFHYPIQVWDCKHHGAIHLYGHVHSDKENHHPLLVKLGRAYNVGVDVNNYAPVSLEHIVEALRDITI
jgi:calcineurin-like phosphoesterase family protein